VLLISQRMDRTGAPSQLVTLLPGLGESLSARTTLLCGSEGSLVEVAAAHVDRVLREPVIARALGRAVRAVPPTLGRGLGRLRAAVVRARVSPVDVVYVNSLISTRLARAFAGRPMVVHVHEMGGLARSFGDEAEALMRAADRVLVPSDPAREWVLSRGIPPARVLQLPGSVPVAAFDLPDTEQVERLRERLAIDADCRVVTTVGWIGSLKGSDRFLDVAAHVRSLVDGPLRFLWIGAGSSTHDERRFPSEIAARGLDGVVSAVPPLDDLRPALALSDVVLVASREETLSLVALEAAAQGRAVVAYPGAGGPDELAREGILSNPAGGVEGIAGTIVELLRDTARRHATGGQARERVRELHHPDAARAILVQALAEAAPRRGARPGGAA
jgi:glycosyltransferase involved in cell wall biosynthesis